MAPPRPIVLEGLTVASYIKHLLELDVSVTLIVCGNRDSLVRRLVAEKAGSGEANEVGSFNTNNSDLPPQWLEPTLRMLGASRRMKLVFTADISHFRAYLALHSAKEASGAVAPQRPASVLAVLNLIDVHRFTSSFSAQGIHRSLAALVEAADSAAECLIICECATLAVPNADAADGLANEERIEDVGTEDPWEKDLSILNATNRAYNSGRHGWAGRTIKLRTIAERWFTFASIR